MARIADGEIERLKTEVSLVRLVEARGVELKKHGKDWLGRCPFHDDKTPSLVVTPSSNLWHCLGACNVGGSVIDWVMKVEGISFRHAVELLKADHLPSLVAESDNPIKPVKQSTVRKLDAPLSANADEQTALKNVMEFYHETLKQSPEALAYLEKRGLNNLELIDTFKLGYANRTLAYRLPQKNRKEGAELRGRLQQLGVLRDSGHEHLNGSIVVPLHDEAENVVQMYGRKLLDNLRPGTSYHLYLPGPHRGVWNVQALRDSREIILCEALIDAMTFWVHGYRNVTTAYGVNGFTDELLNAFITHGVQKVLIAFDRDEAGSKAAEELAKRLNEHGIDAFRVLLPKGMDVNEYALKVQPANKSLGVVLRKSEWMGNGVRSSETDVETENNTKEVIPSLVVPAMDGEMPREDRSPKRPESVAVELPTPAVALVDVPADITVAHGILPPATLVHPCTSEHEIHIRLEDRHYRVRGLNKNLSYELLKVHLQVRVGRRSDAQGCASVAGGGTPGAYHVDTVDLYAAKQRAAFVKQAASETGLSEELLKADLGQVLLKLEELQDQLIKGVLTKTDKSPVMADAEVKEALALLRDPNLMNRVLSDFARCGVVGEEVNKQVAYLAAVSRKLDKPLAVMVQSSSAAGKSSLMEAVLRFMPSEERIQYSAMTGQSLFYLGEKDLQHKILAISEEEGAHNASYALKLLQSEGEVSIASTGKNAVTGNLETQEYRVEGPVMLFSTTTAIDLDEELLNRCLVLSVDESRAQTQAIHAEQRRRRTLEGLRANEDKQRLTRLHQNAQRLLRSVKVVNPYADQLTFLDDKTRTRRDHEKYLALIDAIALLHQYQREIKRERYVGDGDKETLIEYVEVSLDDIALANRLAHEVLGRTLDELPPQTRKLLKLIGEMVKRECTQQSLKQSDYRFSRREVRDFTGWSDGQLKIHCARLEEMEYLLVHRGGRGKNIVYELLFDGKADAQMPHLMGLIDVQSLQSYRYDEKKSGLKQQKSAPSQGQVSPKSASSQGEKITKTRDDLAVEYEIESEALKNALLNKNKYESYAVHDVQVPRAQGCAGVARNDSLPSLAAASIGD